MEQSMQILLVDGASLYRNILEQNLQGFDIKLHFAATGQDALELATREDIRFVLISMQLDDTDGIALTQKLREKPSLKHVPIIILSGSVSTEVRQLAEQARVTEVFRKQDIEELLSFMRRFLGRFQPLSGRVLYVEDNLSQLQAMGAQFRKWGLQVDSFRSADEAWPAFVGQQYDLVITDVVLDGQMSGSRFVNRIRRQPDLTGDVPILALTAFDSVSRRIELFHLGISDYVTKPVLPEELYSRIRSLISTKQLADQDQRLRHALEQAKSASHAKSDFLANISHEIRTPLNAVTGMAQLIRRAGLPDDQLARLDKLESSSEHLLEIINAVLDLSKIEAGRFELEESPIRIESLLRNFSAILRDRVLAKGLDFVVENFDLPLPLLGDPTRLQQALLNYASNAIKFTESGSITVGVRLVEQTEGNVLLRFEVRDTGIGIAADILPKLFAAFEQADNTTTRKYGGTGLGLAITRKLAELMGGTAGAESSPGAGSTFWFTARLKVDGQSSLGVSPLNCESAEVILKRDYPGRQILLADDEPINQEITSMLLGETGQIVDIAGDGSEAVAMAARKVYDLILMDMQMPRLNGLDATREIRQLAGCANVPILAMTANAFVDDKEKCFKAGMNDFIAKPVASEVLYQAMVRWLAPAAR